MTPTKPFFLNKLTDKDTGTFVWRLPCPKALWITAANWDEKMPMHYVFELNGENPSKSRIIIEKMGE